MNPHLTEQQLLDYQFDLLDPAPHAAAARHLEDCAVCRQLADQTRRKMGALDVLKGLPVLPEDLVADTLQQLKARRTIKPAIRFPRPAAWVGVAAAAALVLILFHAHVIRRPAADSAPRLAMRSAHVRYELAPPPAAPEPVADVLGGAAAPAEVAAVATAPAAPPPMLAKAAPRADGDLARAVRPKTAAKVAPLTIPAEPVQLASRRSESFAGQPGLMAEHALAARSLAPAPVAPPSAALPASPAPVPAAQTRRFLREIVRVGRVQLQTWGVAATNPGSAAARVEIQLVFSNAPWQVWSSDPAVQVSTNSATLATVALTLPAGGRRDFDYTLQVPISAEKNSVPVSELPLPTQEEEMP